MLKNSIFETLAFFDAQDLALTAMELKNNLKTDAGPSEIEKCIDQDLRGKAENKDGLFFLRGRSELVAKRKQRYQISLLRFRKAKRYLKFLRHLPYLRAVALSGSQALLNSETGSDIDLFIITKKNRVWITRALISLYFQIIGQRRHGKHIANRFCLNHYLAAGQEIQEDRNLYTAVEYASLLPVLGSAEMDKFWQANQWVKEFLPHASFETKSQFFAFEFSGSQKICETVLDYTVGPALNYLLGRYQKRRIRKQEYILVSENELSFHPGSRGQQVLKTYQNRILDKAL